MDIFQECQDSSGSNWERMVGREHEESFSHMNIGTSEVRP